MKINVVFDPDVRATAPGGFVTAVSTAVAYLDALVTDNVSVTIQFGWGTSGPVSANQSGVAGRSLATWNPPLAGDASALVNALDAAYLRNGLSSVVTDALIRSGVGEGGSQLPYYTSAQAQALQLPDPASNSANYVALNSTIAWNFDTTSAQNPSGYSAVSVLLHEITEVLGRADGLAIGLTLVDYFTYSAIDHRQINPGGGWFSLDGTKLLSPFSSSGDGGDWDSSIQGDAFGDAPLGSGYNLGLADMLYLKAVGFQVSDPQDAPRLESQDAFFAVSTQNAVDQLIHISNPIYDPIGEYRFSDTGTGGSYFTLNGAAQAHGSTVQVEAADLQNLKLLTPSSPGTDEISVAAFDVATQTWIPQETSKIQFNVIAKPQTILLSDDTLPKSSNSQQYPSVEIVFDRDVVVTGFPVLTLSDGSRSTAVSATTESGNHGASMVIFSFPPVSHAALSALNVVGLDQSRGTITSNGVPLSIDPTHYDQYHFSLIDFQGILTPGGLVIGGTATGTSYTVDPNGDLSTVLYRGSWDQYAIQFTAKNGSFAPYYTITASDALGGNHDIFPGSVRLLFDGGFLISLPPLSEALDTNGSDLPLRNSLAVQAGLQDVLRWQDPSFGAPLIDSVTKEAASLTQATTQIIHEAASTSTVAILAYEFFTGSAPSAGGMDYLVSPTGPNPDNLNSAYYAGFNTTNRYINFASNLGRGGAGSAQFAADYGSLTPEQAMTKAYQTIFGGTPSADKVNHLLYDLVPDGNGGTETRLAYFETYGQDGPSGVGTKAAMVGWLLAEAVAADLGTYAKSNDAFLTDVALHNAAFGVDIIGHYAQPSYVYQPT